MQSECGSRPPASDSLCSLRQNSTCTGATPLETLPLASTTTCVVYLRTEGVRFSPGTATARNVLEQVSRHVFAVDRVFSNAILVCDPESQQYALLVHLAKR